MPPARSPAAVLRACVSLVLWLVAALAALAGAGAAAQPRFDFASTPGTLPKAVVPERYELLFDVDPQRSGFDGRATIELRAAEPVAEIVLHAEALEPAGAVLVAAGAPRRELVVHADAARGLWRLVPADGRPVDAGEQRVELHWRGRVRRAGEGLYLAEHRVQGRPARMLATQLQAVHARSLFPGFDEPVFRARFEIAVRAPAGYEVVSNMPRVERRADRGAELHRFAPSPAMPSYLVAFAVGRFDVLEDRLGELPLRIFTAPGKREQARFAMATTKQLLPWLEQTFGQPHGLPKLDQLAVPGTREGAMEDWGLISYAEELLLYDPGRSAPQVQRTVFDLVAHELAHLWFGNLVSIASWNELWLNEAFAVWMAGRAAAHFHPEWQPALQRRVQIEEVLARDAGSATRAVRGGTVDETRVYEVFDEITYTKGAAVLAMLEDWLGEPVLRQGLAAYMAERRGRPATAGDLWHHLSAAAGRDVAAVAASWTDQPGFPRLRAELACRRDGEREDELASRRTWVTLRQSRFALGPALPAARWRVPVRLARGDELRSGLLEGDEASFEWAGCDDRPVVVNAGGDGFFRVDYDATMRERLLAGFAALPPIDRVVLLSDSFALAHAGRLPLAAHFDLLARLPLVGDDARGVLFALAARQLAQLDDALDGTPLQPRLRAAARALLAPELARLGWTPRADESPEAQRLRAELIERLAAFDDAQVIAEAQARFVDTLAGSARALPASIRRAVLRAVGTHADESEFRALLAALRASGDDDERFAYALAAAAGRDPGRAARLLQEAVAGTLPPVTAASLPALVAAQPALAPLAYEFGVRHFDALARLSGSAALGGRFWLLPGALGSSVDPALARRLLEDQQRLAGAAGAGPAAQAAAQVDLRVQLREAALAALPAVLADWAPRR